ncbi:MAG: hypothetical protein SFU53_07975 [Terrimicrobiaceae bacterium]|nr:hypothetical protein [Terrimicrobiaceae bacterium]
MKPDEPEQFFRDSWRPEDKAMESAEEAALEREFPEEIQRRREERYRNPVERQPESDAEKPETP